MKINVVCAHPLADSYLASLHHRVVRTLKARGDEVVDFDLHEMNFDPVMRAEERRGHFDPSQVPEDLRVYIDALRWAEACVFCFPTWWSGMPAILKGYFDRVWRPGIAYEVPADGGAIKPILLNINRMGVVTTCGSPWWYTEIYMQNPGKKVLLRGLKTMCGRNAKHLYLTRYSVEGISNEKREMFAREVERRFETF
ncbi:Putative NADPH-quinone reductase (modulator of drug activity B) [Mesorhizobium sp. NFR06]|jgi:putative NADPH-quinone reductase|uniref:NAD(P)H-dependent oxidoreductase n=1 Tax=Mesorhizobium sp. NFR06 TaxID=1566290 RepID=UPI0008EE1094|nr:NAD(P)H-dependent oxidoreductase [Mesorhizobium sp. NFR06]SFO66579.1 Putative NADPH-quinone reductase (modulator of drug activity B) [Mesorhizobium sp. NFR06]